MSTHMKKHNKNTGSNSTSQLPIADTSEGQEYGEITRSLGNCRFEVRINSTGNNVNAPICGSFHRKGRKVFVKPQDTVLLVKNISNGYIIAHKYNDKDVKTLIKSGEIKQITKSDDNNTSNNKILIAFENEAINQQTHDIDIDDDFIAHL